MKSLSSTSSVRRQTLLSLKSSNKIIFSSQTTSLELPLASIWSSLGSYAICTLANFSRSSTKRRIWTRTRFRWLISIASAILSYISCLRTSITWHTTSTLSCKFSSTAPSKWTTFTWQNWLIRKSSNAVWMILRGDASERQGLAKDRHHCEGLMSNCRDKILSRCHLIAHLRDGNRIRHRSQLREKVQRQGIKDRKVLCCKALSWIDLGQMSITM